MKNENLKLAKDIITHCRIKIQKRYSFFSIALYFLTLEEDYEIETIATDGYYLYYNPEYIIKAYKHNKNLLYISIVHVLLHCLLRHFTKRQFTDHDLFDATMDISVYLMLQELGFITLKAKEQLIDSMPELKTFLKTNIGNASVNIYNEALKNEKLKQELLSNYDIYKLDSHIYWTRPNKIRASKQSLESIKQAWIRMFNEVGEELKGNGIYQGMGKDFFATSFLGEDIEKSKVSYEEFLKRFASLEELMEIDYDEFDMIWYTTGLKMYNDIPIIEYNEYKEDYVIKEFVLAIDTSGSCSGDIMKNFLSQTIKIFEDIKLGNRKVKIKIIQCDSEIVDEKDITDQFDIENYTSNFKAFGFRGTDFNPVFDRINELQKNGQLNNLKGLIYLSDGYGSFPSKKPNYETVFVIPPSEYENDMIPDWVTKINL